MIRIVAYTRIRIVAYMRMFRAATRFFLPLRTSSSVMQSGLGENFSDKNF